MKYFKFRVIAIFDLIALIIPIKALFSKFRILNLGKPLFLSFNACSKARLALILACWVVTLL
ncbi:hypothetical protein [Campylobacter upsaliensis]|uniref:hypothetical protein n=1 Tax=Campylobacter upsaliensis TaxID=28080 RepID=UPI0015F27236|nr:hypothetical protein [Campylobacter upsaliensis]